MKDKVLSVALIFIIVLKCFDLYIDFSEELSIFHLVQESTLILISSVLFIFLMFDIRNRSKSLNRLKAELNAASLREREVSEELRLSKRDFFTAVQNQFTTWHLTPSEKDVALFLLKGLSLQEIANLRQTSEKTIRHHASSIYRKAECSGRHELAALFFEEFN